MNIFGVGGMELALILIIMLIVAGPKRMIRWAYIVGTYTAKFRRMWEETVDYIQKEVDEAGLDIQVPREVPTKATLNREIGKIMAPVTKPVEEALGEVGEVKRSAVNTARVVAEKTEAATASTGTATATPVKPTTTFKPSVAPKPAANSQPAASNGATDASRAGFGTWSGSSSSSDREASS